MTANKYVGTNADNVWQVVNPGTFTLDGLGGIDTLALGTSLRSSYTITQSSDGTIHVDSISGASSALHASLTNMEKLTFNSGRDIVDLTTFVGSTPQAVSTVSGSSSNDTLSVPTGRVNVNGLEGIDTVAIAQPSSSFTISPTSVGFSLTSKDAQSIYTLTSIERLHFSNEKIALDLGASDHAAEVVKTLGAVFGDDAVSNATYVGIGLTYLDSGMSYIDLMGLALGVALSSATTNEAVVNLLYQNVIGIAPTPAQAQPYIDLLVNKVYTPAQLGVMAADTTYNQERVGLTGVLLQTGVHYA